MTTFQVNQNTTIKNFTTVDEFKNFMKFGHPEEYQKFVGECNGKKVTGWICLKDDNIYGMEEVGKYEPNGTPEDIKIGILHDRDGYYVSNEGTKQKPNFHVWIPNVTHAVCDSAYDEISLAVARCNYLHKNQIKPARS